MTDTYTVTATESGERIDALLARWMPELTRARAQKLIAEGRVHRTTLDPMELGLQPSAPVALTGGDDMKTFCQIVFNAASGIARTDLGLVAASFILGTIPLMLITCSCLKYYLEGMVAGAVKG